MKRDTETIETAWTPAEDLEWTAFQYVANELPDADAVAFEQRLADDQLAREAVARCVQLTHSVVALEEAREGVECPAAGLGRGNRRQRRWWVAAAVVAIAAVCGAYWIGTEVSQRDGDEPGNQIAGPHQDRQKAGGKIASIVKPSVGNADASAIISTWLSFDTSGVWGFEGPTGPTQQWEEPAKPAAPPVEDGSFNWVIAAVDDAPLAVPVPEKSPKEPN